MPDDTRSKCPKCGAARIDEKHFACDSEVYGNAICMISELRQRLAEAVGLLRKTLRRGPMEVDYEIEMWLKRHTPVQGDER